MAAEIGHDEIDKWATWLLHRRDGDDQEQQERAFAFLRPVRDRVLNEARIVRGDVLLDVGAGDGLIAFGAIDRVGPAGHVVYSDVSRDILEHGRSTAEALGVRDRLTFVETRAEDLAGIDDESVDVLTTRSVLIYVDDKAQALRAFARVLRSRGRLSLFEPINNYFPLSVNDFCGFDATGVEDLVAKYYAYEGWTEEAANHDAMLGFSDKDLVADAEAAGFRDIRLDLVVEVRPGSWVVGWDVLLRFAPNPNAHTVAEVMAGAFSEEERERFARHLRPMVDAGDGVLRVAGAYLRATK
jgi:ubiquinone/menaquinone biosynthesis C-methylase UbiE